MKSGSKQRVMRRKLGIRLTAMMLIITMLMTLQPVTVHGDIFDWIEENFDNLSRSTVGTFIKEGLTVLGMDKVYKKAKEAVNFASDVANGGMPVVETIMDSLTDNVEEVVGDAVSEMSKITEVLKELEKVGKGLYDLISSIPFNFDTELNIPMPEGGNARVRARKQDLVVDISFWLNGPPDTGIQSVFGLSNASPLGDGNAEHFANDSHIPTVFMDITLDGKSYFHGRMPMGIGLFPYVISEFYISLPSGQLVKVNLGALDETALAVEFGVAVEATCDYAVTVSGGVGVSVSLEVSPDRAAEVLSRGMYILAEETGKIITGNQPLTIDNVHIALEEVLRAMDTYANDHAESLGEATIGVSLEAGLGAGIWDCTWNFLTLDTGLELVLPAADLGSVVGKGTLSSLVTSGKTLAEIINVYGSTFLDKGITINAFESVEEILDDIKLEWEDKVNYHLSKAANDLLEAGIASELELYLSVDALGGRGQGVNMMGAEATIPIGEIVDATVDCFMATIEGMAKFLGQLMDTSVISYDDPPEWDGLDEVAEDIADGTRFRFVVFAPPIAQLVLEASAKPLLSATKTGGELLKSALLCMVNSAKSGSFAEFKTSKVLENLVKTFEGLRDMTLGLQVTFGAYAEAGAEGYAGAGAGINLSVSSNAEMFLIFFSGQWDSADYVGQAKFNFSANISAEGGVSLGEGVELKAGAGLEASTNFLTVTATEWDEPAPVLYNIAGSSSANLQSLEFHARGYNMEMQTFTANYVQDSRYFTGGYYEVWLPSTAPSNWVTVEATAFSSFAKMLIRDSSSTREGTGAVTANYLYNAGGQIYIELIIISYDQKTQKIYPIIIKAAPNLQLSKLEISKGSLTSYPGNSSAFDPRKTDYKLSLDCDTSEVTITPTLAENNNTILQINGTNWDKGKAYTYKNIPYGESNIRISVKFPNSTADERLKENTYWIKVYRAKSANADLSKIELNRRELVEDTFIPLDFRSDRVSYNVSVEPEVAGINLMAAVADDRAELRLGIGNPPANSEPSALSIDRLIPLQYEDNKIYIEVTAQNGNKKTYTLIITRRKYQLDSLKVMSSTQEMKLSQGQTTTQGFNPDVMNYVLRVPQGVSYIKSLEFDTSLQNAEIHYYDNTMMDNMLTMHRKISLARASINSSIPPYKPTGVYKYTSSSIALPGGDDWEAKLVINASQDYINGVVYVINILPQSKPLEAGAELKELFWKTAYDSEFTALDISKKSFNIVVNEDVSNILLKAAGKNAGDTIVVNGSFIKELIHAVPVEPGSNLIDVNVISRHGAVENYALNVFRKRNSETNNYAEDIKVEGFALNQSFNQMMRAHSVEVPYEKSSVRILVKPESTLAEVGTWITNGKQQSWSAYPKEGGYYVITPSLQVGVNNIPIRVKPKTGNVNNYELNITRLPSNDATLNAVGGLVLKKLELDPDTGAEIQNEILDIGFSPNNTNYTVTVDNEFNAVLFKATATKENEGAKVAFEAEEISVLPDGWHRMPLFEEKNIHTGGEFPIKARENILKVIVTAPNGADTRTYAINIIRDLPPDEEAPTLIKPIDMTVEGNTLGGANVEFSVRASDIRDGYLKPESIRITLPGAADNTTFEEEKYALACRTFLPLGTHDIYCEAWDKAGNVAQGSFKITVVDTKGPELSGLPSRLDVQAASRFSTPVLIPEGVTAYDIVDGECEVIFSPASLPMGHNYGDFVAKDSSGNISSHRLYVYVGDTEPPTVDITDYDYYTDMDEVYITWDHFLQNNVAATDNTGIKGQEVYKYPYSDSNYAELCKGITLKAGSITRFQYRCWDYGYNYVYRDFYVRVKYSETEAPVAKKPENLRVTVYPDDADESLEFILEGSDLATDRNLDELEVLDITENTNPSVASATIDNGMLKITTNDPGRTNITVEVTDGLDIVSVMIPIKVYDSSEALEKPQSLIKDPIRITKGQTIEFDIDEIAEDENDEYLSFLGGAWMAKWLVNTSIQDNKLVITGESPGSGVIHISVSDGSHISTIDVPIVVNSLPELVPDIEKVYPQLTKKTFTKLEAEIAINSELRIKVNKAFKDVDGDSLIIDNISSDDPDVATVSLSPDEKELIIEGHKKGETDITIDVFDGYESASVTIHVEVDNLKVSRIFVNTMPKNYPYKGDNKDELDLTGMSIIAAYNDGKSKVVTYSEEDDEDWTITGYMGSDEIGDQEVTLTWGGASVDFIVTVYSQMFDKIYISIIYPLWYVGDTAEKILKLNRLECMSIPHGGGYFDAEPLTIAPGNIKGFDTSKPSPSVPVWVEYGNTVSEAVYVEVKPVEIKKIELALDGDIYAVPRTIVGNPLDLTGWDITAEYNNGDRVALDQKEVDIIDFDNSEVGLTSFRLHYKTVYETVYEDVNVDFITDPFNAVIDPNYLADIELNTLPHKTVYWQDIGLGGSYDDILNFEGMTFTATYEDGKTALLAYDDEEIADIGLLELDRSLPGDKKMRVLVRIKYPTNISSKEFEIPIKVVKNSLVKMEITRLPEKREFIGSLGISYHDFSDIVVRGTYESGEVVEPMRFSVSSFYIDTRPGKDRRVVIEEDGQRVSFTIDIEPEKVVGMELISPPEITDYYIGDTLSKYGMKVIYHYNTGDSYEIPDVALDDSGFSGFDSRTPQMGQVVTYTIDDASVSFTVNVQDSNPIGLRLVSPPYRTWFYQYEEIDLSGLDLKVVYPYGREVDKEGFMYECLGYDSSKPVEDQEVTIKLWDLTTSFKVDILPPEEVISMNIPPTIYTEHLLGEPLNMDGRNVLVEYMGRAYNPDTGKVEPKLIATSIWPSAEEISGFNSSRPVEEQEITVSYKGKSDSYTIEILPLELQGISVKAGLTDYYIGEPLFRSTLKINADYNNGSRKSISPELVNISGFDSSKEATGQEVIVDYQGKQDSFLVNILSGVRPGPVPVSEQVSEGGSDSDDDSDSGSDDSTRDDDTTPAPAIAPDTKDSMTISPDMDGNTSKVIASIDADMLEEAFNKLNEDETGVIKLSVEIPPVDGAMIYEAELPSGFLTGMGMEKQIEIKTNFGAVTVPGNMLDNIPEVEDKTVGISIGLGDKSSLPEEVQKAIGIRPIIQLTLTVDGEQAEWNNPDAPVTVSIPYVPTAEELANPESIVIWYIDGSGNVVTVNNGRYDPVTGTVTFTTTHFSYYAVVYNSVNFTDVIENEWYNKAVNFIAARGITKGTGNGKFSPDAMLTRGEFIVLLMRAFDIEAEEKPIDNFSDAGNTYYTNYLAKAKKLGISAGVGDNMFAPNKAVTRQEMFTMLYNALKVIKQLPKTAAIQNKSLSDFTDANQIAPWAEEAMKLLVESGIVKGSAGKITPTEMTSRAQMAQVLYNLMTK